MLLVTRHVYALADLLTDNLNLDIDLNEAFAERVDLDETWVDRTIETTELGDQADVTLRNRLVWIGTADATREGAHGSNT